MIGMRIAEELAAARPRALGPLLRAAAQGRRLLGQRGADGGAVRRRRPGGQAHVEAGRLVEPAARVPVVAADRRARRLAARARVRAAARASGRGRGHAQVHGGALRPRRRDRAHALPVRGDRGRDPQPRRALGRPRHARRPRAARRSRCSRASSASRRRSRSSTPHGGVDGRARGRRAGAAAAGSTRRSSTRCWRICRDRGVLARRSSAPDVSGWEPADLLLRADDDRLDRIAEAFARVIDAKSPFTARHSERVAEIAVGIGGVLGFDADALRDLRRAGLLHDVGKLAISNLILDKPGKLTDDEFALDQGSTRSYSLAILERAPCFAPIAAARRQPPRADRRHAATRAAWPARSSTCRCACSRSPTSTRRSPPTAPTAGRCRSSRRSTIVAWRGARRGWTATAFDGARDATSAQHRPARARRAHDRRAGARSVRAPGRGRSARTRRPRRP